MKKLTMLLAAAIMACGLYAQTYTVVSRNNPDTIKMYLNALGSSASALKSMIPGSKPETPQYRLIKKTYQGKESLIFVDFTKILDKILVAYETDMVTPGEWQVTTISYSDLYNAVKRENAIYLSGEILGMKVEMFQCPPVIWEDIVRIDGIEFPLPLKLAAYESELAQKAQKAAEKELQKQEKERIEAEKAAAMSEKEKEQAKKKAEEMEAQEKAIRELAKKEENKAYIALLLKTSQTNTANSAEITKYFVNEEIMGLVNNKSVEELKAMSASHDKFFERFKGYNRY